MKNFKMVRWNACTEERKSFVKAFPDAKTAIYSALSNNLMANAWHIVSCVDEAGTEHCKN